VQKDYDIVLRLHWHWKEG